MREDESKRLFAAMKVFPGLRSLALLAES